MFFAYRNESIVNFILTTPDPVFFKSIPTATERHTGEYMANIISTVIEEIGPDKFLSCVTDNASNMKRAWLLLAEKYPHMSFYGCLAHSLNLLIEDILKLDNILSLKNQASRIVTQIKSSQLLTAHFVQIQKEKNVNIALKLPVKTRWASVVRCFNSLISNKFCLQTLAVNEAVVQNLQKDIKALLLDDDIFWVRLENTQDLLEPIGKWITKIEEDKPNASLVPEIFANLKSVFAEKVPKCPANKVEEKKIMEILIDRQDFCLHKFHLAANILDPHYQGHSLSPEEHVDGLEFINKIAEHIKDVEDREVITDFAKYKAKDGLWAKDFVWKCAQELDPTTWWKGMCSTSALSKVACAILSMATTSAATERSFSTYSQIHTKKRNRLTTARAGKIVYISHNLKLLSRDTTKNRKTTTGEEKQKSKGSLSLPIIPISHQEQDPSESSSLDLCVPSPRKRKASAESSKPPVSVTGKKGKHVILEFEKDTGETSSTEDESSDSDNDTLPLSMMVSNTNTSDSESDY